MTKVLIIGAGGIGSQLLDLLIPALTARDMAKQVGGIQIHVMDDDRVEITNLFHQRHEPRMVGRLKVNSSAERLAPYLSSALTLKPIGEKLLRVSQLEGFDLVVVAVDRPQARLLVHENSERWLDLRCGGDAMIALDYLSDSKLVEMMTPLDQAPASCQIPGSIEVGNVQMGYALAAAHGAQWVIQQIRELSGLPFRPTPARMYSLTFGELEFPAVPEIMVGGDES
jgi:molybdopterin/thiamine biosynthesis adenylyltransferase